MGDGITCTPIPIDMCDSISCTENATCEIVNELNTLIARCTCYLGYTGNGQSCVLIDECEQACSTSGDPNIHCIVSIDDRRIDCGSEYVQELQETVRDLEYIKHIITYTIHNIVILRNLLTRVSTSMPVPIMFMA